MLRATFAELVGSEQLPEDSQNLIDQVVKAVLVAAAGATLARVGNVFKVNKLNLIFVRISFGLCILIAVNCSVVGFYSVTAENTLSASSQAFFIAISLFADILNASRNNYFL